MRTTPEVKRGTTAPRAGHDVKVKSAGAQSWMATCSCGWTWSGRLHKQAAEFDAEAHLQRSSPTHPASTS